MIVEVNGLGYEARDALRCAVKFSVIRKKRIILSLCLISCHDSINSIDDYSFWVW